MFRSIWPNKKFSNRGNLLLSLTLILFLSILISCTGTTGKGDLSGPVYRGQLPKLLSKTASNGSLRADLKVYGPDGSEQHREDLQINFATGEVFSEQFELPRGFTFSFVIVFYYTQDGIPELPIAFVAKVEDTEESFLSVIWEESEVMVSQNQIDPSISASLSTSNLPDLDADDDGYSNFAEIREGSDPTDPNSGPQAPEMGVPDIAVKSDYIELTVDFFDASGVNTIKPTGTFTCGYFEWEVELLDGEGLTKRLKAKFNLHAHESIVDNGKVDLQYLVSDVLGASANYIISAESVRKNQLALSDPLNQPAINIIAPGNGETINSDFFSVDAQACDEDPLIDFSLINIAGFSDADGNIERVAGTLNSGTLGDSQVLTFEATDDQGNTKTQSITVKIDTNNPIKVDAPTPGSTISDGFTVAAHVDKKLMTDVTQFFIEKITTTSEPYAEIFELNQLKFDVNSLPEAFTGQVFDVSQVGVGEFLIWFVAIGPESGRVELPVKFFLNIKPIIERFEVLQKGPELCLIDGNIELGWKVANLGNDGEVKLEGQLVDANDTTVGNPNLSGPIPCQDSVLLEATRFVLDQSTGNNDIPIDADPSSLSLTKLRIKSFPKDGILPENFLLEFEEVGGSSYNFASLYWEVQLTNLDSGASIFRSGTGGQIDNSDLNLDIRTSYQATISLLSGPGGVVISTGQPFYFVTGDSGLVAWWRFDDGSGYSVKDYSGNNNHLALLGGAPTWISSPPLEGLDLVNPEYLIGNNSIGGQADKLTVEILVDIQNDPTSDDVKYLIAKDKEFSLGFVGAEYQIILGLTPNDCSDSGFLFDPWYEFPTAIPAVQGLHYLVLTFDGAEIKFFVNGQEKFSNPINENINSCNANFGINNLNPVTEPLNGIVGEAAVYERVLPESEIYRNWLRNQP